MAADSFRYKVFFPIMAWLVILAQNPRLCGAPSQWVYYDPQGRLAYKTWGAGNRIMDFSHAGYKGGGIALPDVDVKVTVNASGGDDTQLIQNAINTVSAMPLVNGFRVLYFWGRGRLPSAAVCTSGPAVLYYAAAVWAMAEPCCKRRSPMLRLRCRGSATDHTAIRST